MVKQVANKIFKFHGAIESEYPFDRYDQTRADEISDFLLSRSYGWYQQAKSDFDSYAAQMGLTDEEREFALDNPQPVCDEWNALCSANE